MRAFVLKDRGADFTVAWMAAFVVAVVVTVLACTWLTCVFLKIVPLMLMKQAPGVFRQQHSLTEAFHVSPWLFGIVFFIITCFVLKMQESATFSRVRNLNTAGLMQYLGAIAIDPQEQNPYLRRLANVNEEIAIASGRLPARLYWLEGEEGINAFTAGVRAEEASICVTEGALRYLSRDELQAVVAHEYGHISCNDVRRNTLMIRWLALLMPYGFEPQQSNYLKMLLLLAGSSVVCFVIGLVSKEYQLYGLCALVMLIVGLIAWLPSIVVRKMWRFGALSARMTQAAVSCEREFEADALSVQFTRNPESLADALRKIAGLSRGTQLQTEKASMFAHMCIAPALISDDDDLYAMHPPIEERLEALGHPLTFEERQKLGSRGPEKLRLYANEVNSELGIMQAAPAAAARVDETIADDASPGEATPERETRDIDVGAITPLPDPRNAEKILATIPAGLREVLRTPAGARAAARSLLLLPVVETGGTEDLLCARFRKLLNEFGPRYRLPLLALAMPALQNLKTVERIAFVADLRARISADGKISLHEFIYFSLLSANLCEPPRIQSELALSDAYAIVLGAAAHAFSEDAEAAASAFAEGARLAEYALELPARNSLSISRLEAALAKLRDVAEQDRVRIPDAVAAVVARDGAVTISELEFVRAVCAAVGCPIPLLEATATASSG
jgi:Zn-dependent protease with chaperone function